MANRNPLKGSDPFSALVLLSRVLKMQSGISPEMALRLSKALGRSPESWLSMQDAYDLWQAKKRIKLGSVHKVNINAA